MSIATRSIFSTVRAALLIAFALWVPLVHAQTNTYPTKPIRFILPFPIGQGADIFARFIGQFISDTTGQAVIVDNRPGASGMTAARAAASAAPDGYTVFVTTNTTHAANVSLFKKLPYDPVKDFAPVTLLNKGGLVFVVRNDSALKTAGDLLAKAKSAPDGLTYGTASSSTRISAELFMQLGKVKAHWVPYKGTPQVLTDLIGGQLDFAVADIPTAQPLILQGQLRPLAITSTRRHPTLPNVPTWAESGLPGFELDAWTAVYVPAGTPRPIIDKLNSLVRSALASPGGKELYLREGLEATPGTPEDLAAFARSETDKWARIVRGAGIEPE